MDDFEDGSNKAAETLADTLRLYTAMRDIVVNGNQVLYRHDGKQVSLTIGNVAQTQAEEIHFYDPAIGDDMLCQCSHPYERHFDSYNKMIPIGCKYCKCRTWIKQDVQAAP